MVIEIRLKNNEFSFSLYSFRIFLRVECVHVTSILVHGVLERPFVVDAEGVDQTFALYWPDLRVEANGFLSVDAKQHHDTSKIVGQPTG